ncbi:TD and POZ domain-containing protein 4 [Araneus ventricosus]|uniref:TD and POZ domain-containing protein 4 n=1 Tax=Araneus ventricosus TaxID=182803 RepID=A0A4Y2KYI0_ARAVE|nr:TD and POZ domain-containing protein 4 [Araneus ventricosus]
MSKWHLEIKSGISGSVVLGIVREIKDEKTEDIELFIEFALLNINGLPLVKRQFTGQLKENELLYGGEIFQDILALFRRRAEFMPNDALKVRCQMRTLKTPMLESSLSFACSLIRPDRRIFVWNIREFSTLQREQRKKFFLNSTTANHVSLNFFISENEYINIYMINETKENIFRIKISLLDCVGKTVICKEEVAPGRKESMFRNFFDRQRLINEKLSLLPNDVLSLKIELEMNAKVLYNQTENQNTKNFRMISTDKDVVLGYEQDDAVSSNFTEAMERLLEDGIHSDVNLQTDNQSFPAHKSILSARSVVFRAMFNGDMMEKTSKCVPIQDISGNTMRKLLSYIYTDKVGKLEGQGAVDLYKAADKYELMELKKRCATFINSALSKTNVCYILTVSDMHYDQDLKQEVQNFIISQGAEFLTSDEWRGFKKEHPLLALETVERMVCEKKRRSGKFIKLF